MGSSSATMSTINNECLVRVIAKWLGQAHCPTAVQALAHSIGGVGVAEDVDSAEKKESGLSVHVEAMSGVPLGTFKGLNPKSTTIRDLQTQIADRLGREKFPVHQQLLFPAGSSSKFSADATLHQCRVVDGATLVLALRLNLVWDPKKSNEHLKYVGLLMLVPLTFHLGWRGSV